jgi:hypothetical protein
MFQYVVECKPPIKQLDLSWLSLVLALYRAYSSKCSVGMLDILDIPRNKQLVENFTCHLTVIKGLKVVKITEKCTLQYTHKALYTHKHKHVKHIHHRLIPINVITF